jgi:hypothetical protein
VEPGTTVLPAVVAVALAAAALAFAIGSFVGGRPVRRRLLETERRLDETRGRLQDQVAGLRASLEHGALASEQVRAEVTKLGSMMEGLTDAMAHRRTGMQQLTRRRIGPAVRVLRLASTAARIAYLWR